MTPKIQTPANTPTVFRKSIGYSLGGLMRGVTLRAVRALGALGAFALGIKRPERFFFDLVMVYSG